MEKFIPEIDLHYTHPRDTKKLVTRLIDQAWEHKTKVIRIIHGKGTSQKKLEVYKILEKDSRIYSYDDDGSNWGVTLAELDL